MSDNLIPQYENVEHFRDERNGREAAVLAGDDTTIIVYAGPESSTQTVDNMSDPDAAIAAANHYLDTGVLK